MSVVQALKESIILVPQIHIWSGQVTLNRTEDLSTASGLPPKTLVSDGSKRIIDPQALTPLETQRRAVNRDLARMGVVSPMGYLITNDMEAEAHKLVEERRTKFDAARADLINNFDRLCHEWEQKNPGFEELLRRNRPDVSAVAAACNFDYAMARMEAVDSDLGRERFEAAAKATTSAVIENVCSSASGILKNSFEGRDRVTQKAVNVVRELVAKLRGFAMFDARIIPATDALERTISQVPKTGPLDGAQTLIISTMLQAMAEPDKLLSMGIVTGDAAKEDQEDWVNTQAVRKDVPITVEVQGLEIDPEDHDNNEQTDTSEVSPVTPHTGRRRPVVVF